MKFQTKAIHAGIEPCPATGALITPLHQSAIYVFDDVDKNKGYDYSRTGNPTRNTLSEHLAKLEGGKYCAALATGMAAEATTLSLFKQGDHIICGNDVYGGTFRLFNMMQNQYGIDISFVPMTDPDRIRAELRPNTKALWIETPSNPLFNIVDLAKAVQICEDNDLVSIVDNTLLSPFYQQPIDFGVDIVVHSTTKYLSGHNDGLGGAIVCNKEEHAEKIAFSANAMGTVSGSFDAWLILRGIKTLGVRMREHQRNAMAISKFLQDHPLVEKVYYPGLESHPQYDIIQKQASGHGGLLSFSVKGGFAAAREVLRRTNLFYIAESFGGRRIAHRTSKNNESCFDEC